MSVAAYASLDAIRNAIHSRRVIRFQHQQKQLLAEPHVLAHAPRYGAFIVGVWLVEEAVFQFFRYSEIRDLWVTEESFSLARPEYNPRDRRISDIDTCVRKTRR